MDLHIVGPESVELVEEAGVGPTIHRFRSVESTQDEGHWLVKNGRAGVGHVILADEQTEGRGRFGRTWSSPPRGFYATFLVEPEPLVSLRAGVVVARVLEDLGASVALKWPNDLLAGPRKLGGILVELCDDVALVGVGINLDSVPAEGAVSLKALGVEPNRATLVLAIWSGFEVALETGLLLAEYRRRCASLGRQVRIERQAQPALVGRAVDIDAEGRLLVETGDGVVPVSSGECIHVQRLEPPDGSPPR
jgi:BirA family biotin operon repressor/biotin-[acetyl-CoA-carboxylase] ligase